MSDDEAKEGGLLARVGSRAFLIALVIVAVIVGTRLLTKWLKWLLIAVAVAAVVYLVKSRGPSTRE